MSANYPLFSASNLIERKQHKFLYPTVELAKLSMRNDYVYQTITLTFIESKLK